MSRETRAAQIRVHTRRDHSRWLTRPKGWASNPVFSHNSRFPKAMKIRLVLGMLALTALSLLAAGCSSCPLSSCTYGPSYYDTEGVKAAVVRINDTNYPALLRGDARR